MSSQTRKFEILLNRLLADFAYLEDGDNVLVTGMATDSRQVLAGDVFIACDAAGSNEEKFIQQAIEAGSVAILCEVDEPWQHNTVRLINNVPVLSVHALSEKAGYIASRFYSNPSKQLEVIGVTGTNGKTSCTQLIAQALHRSDSACGVIGTLGSGIWGQLETTGFTTPQSVQLQKNLSDIAQQASAVAIEVSSHGLDQGRVNGVEFDLAVLTNLSRDHLDYHGDMTQYQNAKARLFQWSSLRAAILNMDDPFGRQLAAQLEVPVFGYSLDATARQSNMSIATIVRRDLDGVLISIDSPWGQCELHSPLIGDFNVSNVMAVFVVLMLQDFTLKQAVASLENVRPPAGRMECFHTDNKPLAVVDYAHTPDALAHALSTLRAHCEGSLWVIFGCGGDRDRGKRAEMGAAALRLADRIVLTNDNPRTEQPQHIVDDILQGISCIDCVEVVLDREQAISGAISRAGEQDVLLIAGKGHEDYQIIGKQRVHYSDREVVSAIYGEAA